MAIVIIVELAWTGDVTIMCMCVYVVSRYNMHEDVNRQLCRLHLGAMGAEASTMNSYRFTLVPD